MSISILKALPEHVTAIHALIRELAIYEKAEKEHTATEDELMRFLFGDDKFVFCDVALEDGNLIGIALYYYKYSTWKGRSLYLEDLVVKEEHRGRGLGKKLFLSVVEFAVEQNCGRMDWQVLDWNEPAIGFYERFEANLDGEWINGQFTPEQMKELIGG
jgi:GNAT superfamily N-acetyltransferase